MKRLQYIGSHTAGIFLPGDIFVTRMGAGVEVEDELAADLLKREEDGKPQWRVEPKSRNTSSSSSSRTKTRSSKDTTNRDPRPAVPSASEPAELTDAPATKAEEG